MSFTKDAEIYGENEPAEYVHKVLTGAVRVCKVLQDGRRQIEAFYFAGDVFGLECGAELPRPPRRSHRRPSPS